MKYLIVDLDGKQMVETRLDASVYPFVSHPDLDGDDPCGGRGAAPNMQDVERAIKQMTSGEAQAWVGNREFLIIPLDAAFTVNASASVEVTSTGSRP